jgi:hypothetical protein
MQEARKIAASLPVGDGGSEGKVGVDSGRVDEGVDALLSWTDQLDFDGYYSSWLSIATSARSDRVFFADSTFFEQDAEQNGE